MVWTPSTPALPGVEQFPVADGLQGPQISYTWGDGSPETVNQGQQDEYIAGTNANNQLPGRSILTVDPQQLLDACLGNGQPVGKTPRGQPGYREQFDTGNQIIGIHSDPQTGASIPTTRGTMHYSKNGAT